MFNRTLLSASIALVLATPAAALASTWSIDGGHSEIGFSVRHLMVSNTKGKFKTVEGTIELNDKDITKSTVNVSIDTATIDTDNAKRDEHLKSPDFFDVDKFPKMTFQSTKVKKTKGGLSVTGQLTLHGVTKTVVLSVEGPTPAVTDPWGMTRRGLTASTKINRKDFGLTWNKALEAGGVVVGDEVKITLEVELIKQG